MLPHSDSSCMSYDELFQKSTFYAFDDKSEKYAMLGWRRVCIKLEIVTKVNTFVCHLNFCRTVFQSSLFDCIPLLSAK